MATQPLSLILCLFQVVPDNVDVGVRVKVRVRVEVRVRLGRERVSAAGLLRQMWLAGKEKWRSDAG